MNEEETESFRDEEADEQPELVPPDGAAERGCPVVGVGASAGGLEALKALFCNMPPDSGAAFVIFPHLAADQPSRMVELLERATAMPVREVTDGVSLEPGE